MNAKLSRIVSILVRGMRSEHAMSSDDNIKTAIIVADFAVNGHVKSSKHLQTAEHMLIKNIV